MNLVTPSKNLWVELVDATIFHFQVIVQSFFTSQMNHTKSNQLGLNRLLHQLILWSVFKTLFDSYLFAWKALDDVCSYAR